MIRAQALTRRFGAQTAVDGLSFEVAPGEIYGLLGPNGAGKTTTVRMLSCLLRPSAGTAWVAGHSIDADRRAIRGKIGLLTEVPGLYTRLTPAEYLDFFAQVQDVPVHRRRGRIEHTLHLVGMWDRRDRVMRGFSKGQQQRVAIARALLHEPEVLFFDEPTAALDPEAARAIRDHLLELADEQKRTILLCTHNLPEAERLCSRLSVVQGGRQLVEGTPRELKAGLSRRVILSLRAPVAGLVQRLLWFADVQEVEEHDGGRQVLFRTSHFARTVPEVVRMAAAAGADVLGLTEEEVSLEAVYLELMRRAA